CRYCGYQKEQLYEAWQISVTVLGCIESAHTGQRRRAQERAAFRQFVVLHFSDSRPRNPARACHLMAALVSNPGSRGVGGQLRMIAISCKFHEPPAWDARHTAVG